MLSMIHFKSVFSPLHTHASPLLAPRMRPPAPPNAATVPDGMGLFLPWTFFGSGVKIFVMKV